MAATAALEGNRRRGVKRSLQPSSRLEYPFDGGDGSLLVTPQAPSAKRQRTQESEERGLVRSVIKLILDQPSNAVSWFSNKFLGGGRRGAAPTPPESYFGDSGSSHSSQQPIDMSNKSRTRPGTVALDVPLLLDLTHSEEEEENDEVKILEERVTSPEDRDPSPIKFGTMSYGPLFQRQYGFEVVTKERRQKERLQAQPKTIYEQVRKSKLTASKKPSVNHAFWLSKVSTKNNKDAPLGSRWPLQKTSSFKSKGTPKVDIKQAYNR